MPDEPRNHEIRELYRALPVPDALYACSAEGCRDEHTSARSESASASGGPSHSIASPSQQTSRPRLRAPSDRRPRGRRLPPVR